MNKEIVNYINNNVVMVLSTSVNDIPWSVSVYYAYNADKQELIFLSSHKTRHYQNMLVNPVISGAITNQERVIPKLKGIQFTGCFKNDLNKEGERIYYAKFPFARIIPSKVGIIQLNNIKFTNNFPIFGRKVFWSRDAND